MASLERDTVYMALIRANQLATDDCHLPFTFALAYHITTYVKNDQTHFIHRFDTHLLLFCATTTDSHRCSVLTCTCITSFQLSRYC